MMGAEDFSYFLQKVAPRRDRHGLISASRQPTLTLGFSC